ncbi:hypothetical protein, partial [Pseudomonas sp. AF1]
HRRSGMKRIGDPQSEEELQAFLGALYTAVQKSEAFLPAALIAQRTAERFFMHCMGDSLALRNGWAMGGIEALQAAVMFRHPCWAYDDVQRLTLHQLWQVLVEELTNLPLHDVAKRVWDERPQPLRAAVLELSFPADQRARALAEHY